MVYRLNEVVGTPYDDPTFFGEANTIYFGRGGGQAMN